jgi:DNA-binding response OmpR family regulator
LKKDLSILKSLNILIVEDNKDSRDILEKKFEKFFNKVIASDNGYNAFELFKKSKVDFVLTDYHMPIMNGHELIENIRKINKKIPVVIASAYTDKDKLLKAIDLNILSFIEKPIIFDNLILALYKVIDYLEDNDLLSVNIDENTNYNFITKKIIKKQEEIKLSKQDLELLELLINNKNQIITKDTISNSIFGGEATENTVRNILYRIRKKLDLKNLITIKGYGYTLKI